MFMKDKEIEKYQQYAKDNNPEMFVNSLFPDKFREIAIAMALYQSNNESFEKPFTDSAFYEEIMEVIAKELYKTLRK
ncbi:MAG: hypothetical protein ACOX16_03265 [Candidatus Izemoplasmatales bacterium]